jgi:hypothetical protein
MVLLLFCNNDVDWKHKKKGMWDLRPEIKKSVRKNPANQPMRLPCAMNLESFGPVRRKNRKQARHTRCEAEQGAPVAGSGTE